MNTDTCKRCGAPKPDESPRAGVRERSGLAPVPARLPPPNPTAERYAGDRQLERQGVPKPPPGVAELCPQPGCRGVLLVGASGARYCDECGKPPVLVRLSGE